MGSHTVREAPKDIPIVGSFDLCVLGGSCTGVFAAVRAARLGLSVAIIEKMGCFGGVATLSLVNVWHSPLDTEFRKQIIAGLSIEVIDRLKRRQAVTERDNNPNSTWTFNSAEMQIELDELVQENKIKPWLHTAFCAPHIDDTGQLDAVIVENKSGRCAIKARFFIDATGDGDLCHRLGLETYQGSHRQPSTTCALFDGWEAMASVNWQKLLHEHREEFDIPDGFVWGAFNPGSKQFMLAGTRIYQDCSDAPGLTAAEIEGRRQVRAIHDILRRYVPEAALTLLSLPARLGIRETRHVGCHYQLTAEDVLYGRSFNDTIAQGSYRVDIHHQDKPGITFRYLDGVESYRCPNRKPVEGRWRPPLAKDPTYYQIPYRCLVPKGPYGNLLVAGRCIDADEQAHAAIRVMVNMNQTGEAAGTAAWLALNSGKSAAEISTDSLRQKLNAYGSALHDLPMQPVEPAV